MVDVYNKFSFHCKHDGSTHLSSSLWDFFCLFYNSANNFMDQPKRILGKPFPLFHE